MIGVNAALVIFIYVFLMHYLSFGVILKLYHFTSQSMQLMITEKFLNLQWLVDSAAIADYNIGSQPDKRALKTLEKHGIIGYSHKARIVNIYYYFMLVLILIIIIILPWNYSATALLMV